MVKGPYTFPRKMKSEIHTYKLSVHILRVQTGAKLKKTAVSVFFRLVKRLAGLKPVF